MHPDQPSIGIAKSDDFEESSDSGNASITPVLSDQNTYISPNGIPPPPHQQALRAHLFQPQNGHQATLVPSKNFQQVGIINIWMMVIDHLATRCVHLHLPDLLCSTRKLLPPVLIALTLLF